MKKRERGALSFRVRKVTSLFLAGLLCFSMPAMAYAAETNGEEQAEAQPSEAVMGDKPVDGDALAIGTEEADAAEFGGAVSVRPEIQSEDAGAENAAGGPKILTMSFRTSERGAFLRKAPLSAMSMPTDLSLSMPG